MDVVAIVIIGVLVTAWWWAQALNYIDYLLMRRRVWKSIEKRIREDQGR